MFTGAHNLSAFATVMTAIVGCGATTGVAPLAAVSSAVDASDVEQCAAMPGPQGLLDDNQAFRAGSRYATVSRRTLADGAYALSIAVGTPPACGGPAPVTLTFADDDSQLRDCGVIETLFEEATTLGDSRLVWASLFCENGEDSFSRDLISALIFLGDAKEVGFADDMPAQILWQGPGNYWHEFGNCEKVNVPWYRLGVEPGTIEVLMESSTTPESDEGEDLEEDELKGDDSDLAEYCVPQPLQKDVIATVAAPAR